MIDTVLAANPLPPPQPPPTVPAFSLRICMCGRTLTGKSEQALRLAERYCLKVIIAILFVKRTRSYTRSPIQYFGVNVDISTHARPIHANRKNTNHTTSYRYYPQRSLPKKPWTTLQMQWQRGERLCQERRRWGKKPARRYCRGVLFQIRYGAPLTILCVSREQVLPKYSQSNEVIIRYLGTVSNMLSVIFL